MKIISIMIVGIALFLSACAPTGFLAEDAGYKSALSHTQKGEIYNSLEMKASIVATYLNNTVVHCQKKEFEVFLVAVYIDEDSSEKSRQGLYNTAYKVTLAGQKPLEIKKLEYDDDLIKIAPFRNRWSHYYVVTFPKQKSETLTLKYRHLSYGAATLNFQKAP